MAKEDDMNTALAAIDAYCTNGIVPKDSRFVLPKTPEYLKRIGSDETEITLPVSVVKKAMETHHLTKDEIKSAVCDLYDPILVFDSDKSKTENKVDSKLILTNEFKDGKPIALAVNKNASVKLYDSNINVEVQDIRSIHDRTLIAKNGTDVIKKWTEDGLCRYVDDKKITDWSSLARVYFPIELLQSADNNILRKSDIVNSQNNFQEYSEERNEVVGVGVAPTIYHLRFNEGDPATRLRPSPTTENSIEQESKSVNENAATNFVLEKLKGAGIEVVTDKDEFNRILKEETLLQKMVEGGESLEKIEHQRQLVNGLVVNREALGLSGDNIANAFKQLDRSLRFNANFEIQSEKLGEEVSVFPGSTGKNGLGIRHIIEERAKKDSLSLDEITALSSLIVDAVQTGDITRDSENRCEISKNGIIAIVRKDFDDGHKNWILTGFHYKGEDVEKNREATETIQTVIAKYGQSPDYSYFRSQVGAVISSLGLNISQTPIKSSGVSKIAEQGNVTEVKDNAILVTSLKTETINKRASIRSPSDTYELLSHIKNKEQEHFGVILLDAAYNVMAVNTLTIGTRNKSLVHPREVFSEAIKTDAASMIVFHNHPSGDPHPSEEDLNTTRALLKLSEIMGIPIIDHVIATKDSYYSFLEQDILDDLYRQKAEFLIKSNQIYGFTHNGKIYLDPDIMNSNAAVHEYTHLWDKYTQNTNPELWERGKEVLSKTHLWDEVKADPNYADISDDDDLILSEVHSRICGEIAGQVLERIAREDGEITRDKAIDWDREVWDYLSNEFLTAEDKEILFDEGQKEQINEFISLSLKDLMEEKEISLSQSMEQPKTSSLELKSDNPRERVKEITSQLEKGVKDLFESKKYQEYLDVMSKFHGYSINNIHLIAMQKPRASLVAGFQTWKKDFERTVKKGEKGIKILVPIPYKKKAAEHENKLGEDIVSEDEDLKTDTKEYLTFRIGHVFDVSQTEGKDLPSLGVDELSGVVEQYSEIYSALEKLSPYPVYFEDIEGATKGYCNFSSKKIAVKNGMSEAQTIKTLVHEISHAKLHENIIADKDKRTAEVQAESVAYTVCKHFGLDTSDYSFAYVTGWSSGKDTKELKESLDLIRRTSVEFIESIEKMISEKISQKESREENMDILKEPKVEISGEMTEHISLLNDNRWIDGRAMPVEIIANAIDYISEKTEYPASSIDDIDSIPEEVRRDAISVALKNYVKDGYYSYLLDLKNNLRQEAFDKEVIRFSSDFKDTAELMFKTLDNEFSMENMENENPTTAPDLRTHNRLKEEDLNTALAAIDAYCTNGVIPKDSRFILPETPEYLKRIGSDETEITLPVSVVKKAMETHHLTKDEIKSAVCDLYDPILVFDSDKSKTENKVDSRLILTNELKDGKPIALSVNVNADVQFQKDGHRAILEVQDIRSIHDRTLIAKNGTDLIKKWTEDGLCRYVDDKKITDWSTIARVYFPIEVLQSADNNILRKSDIVNSRNNFQEYSNEMDNSETINAVVGVGVAPTISALRREPPATRLRPSPTAENSIAQASKSVNEKKDRADEIPGSKIADLDLEYPYKNRFSRNEFSGAWIPTNTANAIKELMENNEKLTPFLPNERGEINARPIYNANTGECLALKDLIPMQIKMDTVMSLENDGIKIGDFYTPIAATKKSIDAARTSIKPGERGVFYNFKRKDGTIGTSQYFFPEQTERPDRVIESAQKKISENHRRCGGENNIASRPTITITSSEPKEYLGTYYAAMITNSALKCSPETGREFKEKFNAVLENQLADKKDFNPKIGTLHNLFFEASKVSNDIIKQMDRGSAHSQVQQKEFKRNGKAEMSR